MKKTTLTAIAASLMLSLPAFADDAHHPGQAGALPPDAKMMQQMKGNLTTMQKQLDRLGKAKTAEERQQIIDEHLQTMQTNMGMARGMQSGTMDCQMMKGSMGMMGYGMHGGMGMMGQGMQGGGMGDMMTKRMDMMEKRMDMMQMMMQQGGMPMMPQGGPAKPAN